MGTTKQTAVVVLCVYRDYPYPWGDPLQHFDPEHSYAFRWLNPEQPSVGQWVIVNGVDGPTHAVIGAIGLNDWAREYGADSLAPVLRVVPSAESDHVHDEFRRAEAATRAVWLNMGRFAAGLTFIEPVAETPPDGFAAFPPAEGRRDPATAHEFGGVWWRAYRISGELGRDPEEGETFQRIAQHWYRVRGEAVKADRLAGPSRIVKSVGLSHIVQEAHHRSQADIDSNKLANVSLTDWLAYATDLASHDREDEAIELITALISAAEQESLLRGHPPYAAYTERAAIIYRKRRDYASEIAVIERWHRSCPPDERDTSTVWERLEKRLIKARALAEGQESST